MATMVRDGCKASDKKSEIATLGKTMLVTLAG